MIIQIPLTIYTGLLVKKETNLKFDKNILKYLLVCLLVFPMMYYCYDNYLEYNNNIFIFIPNLALFLFSTITIYFAITYIIDSRTRDLVKGVLTEIKIRK